MFVVMTLPAMSRPAQNVTLESLESNSLEAISSSRVTMTLEALGTSMPTAALPGMGASMRMSVTARLSLMSSARLVMRLTLMPFSGKSSKRVTEGPQVTSVTTTLMPKLAKVCSSLSAVASRAALVLAPPVDLFFLSKVMGGKM